MYVSFFAFSDFLKYFQELDICHISHDIDQDITFHGRWEVGLNAGGVQKSDWKNFAKNPQCFIRLSDNDPIDPAGRSSAIGGFQLLDLIIMELKSHMTCFN